MILKVYRQLCKSDNNKENCIIYKSIQETASDRRDSMSPCRNKVTQKLISEYLQWLLMLFSVIKLYICGLERFNVSI